ISEMDAFSRAEVTRVKQVVTCTSDRFRESYARRAEDHPRQCVFVGTTNRDDWNHDETGARRFWPIACRGGIDVEAIAADRPQLLAEAVARFKAGETWWEMPIEETLKQQVARYDAPAWAALIEDYLEHEPPSWDWEPGLARTKRKEPLTELTIAEILKDALHLPNGEWTRRNELAVGKALRHLGWTKKNVWRDHRTLKRWVRGDV